MADSKIELIVLAPTTTLAGVQRHIEHALRDTRFAAIVVPPAFVRQAVASTREHAIDVLSVVAYPHGWEKPTVKAIAATSLAKDNVVGLAITPLVANLVAGDVEAYRQELLEIARGARAAKPSIRLTVRIDLDWATLDLPAIAMATIRGAFDGVALASTDLDTLAAGVAAMRAIDGLHVAAIASDIAWADRLLAAGAQRVGTPA